MENNHTDLYSAGVQAFFFNGRRFDLCEVWVGEHESNTFKVWCECSNLLGMFDGDPHREVKTEDGWFKATWDDHFKAWMVKDWSNPISDPVAER